MYIIPETYISIQADRKEYTNADKNEENNLENERKITHLLRYIICNCKSEAYSM